MLVSTTIVESGLDIPNANTLIVDRADAYGLPDLHQLRGRVGRGRERGYAYFLYPPEKPLTETAHERLATIAQHTEMGAGMYVALKDLEIRGAGNYLGGEQSGHIAAVGFDLYVRMIGEAVSELRGDGPAERPEVRIELPVDAHIPHQYVPGERLRLEAYTRIAAIDTDADVAAVAEELHDRFGPPPEPVRNLLAVAGLRARARRAGLTDITQQGSHIRFAPVQLPESRQVRVERLYPRTVLKPAVRTMLVPVPKAGDGARPSSAGGRSGSGRSGPGSPVSIGAPPLRDTELLAWCEDLIEQVLGGLSPAGQDSMRRDVDVLRTSMKLGAAVAAAGLAVAACGPVQAWAPPRSSGSQRISTATLAAQVSDLNSAYNRYKGKIQLQYPVAEMPQQALSWLVRFKVRDAAGCPAEDHRDAR